MSSKALALRELDALWTLPVYPVLEDKIQMGQDEISVKKKIAIRKDHMTYIIVTNFVAGHVLKQQFIEFSLTEQKIRPRKTRN